MGYRNGRTLAGAGGFNFRFKLLGQRPDQCRAKARLDFAGSFLDAAAIVGDG